jgi:hypothetical protein
MDILEGRYLWRRRFGDQRSQRSHAWRLWRRWETFFIVAFGSWRLCLVEWRRKAVLRLKSISAFLYVNLVSSMLCCSWYCCFRQMRYRYLRRTSKRWTKDFWYNFLLFLSQSGLYFQKIWVLFTFNSGVLRTAVSLGMDILYILLRIRIQDLKKKLKLKQMKNLSKLQYLHEGLLSSVRSL